MLSLPDTVAKQKTTDINSTASGTDAVVTINAASSNDYVVIDWVAFSYDATPSSGLIKIVDSASSPATKYEQYVTAGGIGHIPFPERGLLIARGLNVTITLNDGTAAKKLSAGYR